eukprot:CAMPEP_0181244330 /NCGR_PEP_ID=MMETSP1096-20121128/42800_1 /TAXON_ID=156174 ORGANISM="Chrysochromulina ericina, Strain CCMP281" /NCGR_SAMPLE_ID=MMETSP1096 /ASSEMBLY_ACC=CAM_ASM_000453 /LENGTH=118 /DNA_ID=CAMNT_0023340867 /DNA_START=343 /DNA_END=696 /DNA_ORIENTATION=+
MQLPAAARRTILPAVSSPSFSASLNCPVKLLQPQLPCQIALLQPGTTQTGSLNCPVKLLQPQLPCQLKVLQPGTTQTGHTASLHGSELSRDVWPCRGCASSARRSAAASLHSKTTPAR